MTNPLRLFLDKMLNNKMEAGDIAGRLADVLDKGESVDKAKIKEFQDAEQEQWEKIVTAARELDVMVPIEVVMEVLAVYFTNLRLVYPSGSKERALMGVAVLKAALDTPEIVKTQHAARKPYGIVSPLVDAIMDGAAQYAVSGLAKLVAEGCDCDKCDQAATCSARKARAQA